MFKFCVAPVNFMRSRFLVDDLLFMCGNVLRFDDDRRFAAIY